MTTFGVDALPLLAHKIAPRQFDLSYRFSHISLRDQIVRAQMVVRTLHRAGLVEAGAPAQKSKFQLLICGAGMAGLAAAKEAHARGISFVLVEKEEQVPGGVLASKANRYVSTGMYEWPRPNHIEHDYPLRRPELLGEDLVPGPTLNLAFHDPVLIKDFSASVERSVRSELDEWKRNFRFLQSGKGALEGGHLALHTQVCAHSKAQLRDTLNGKVSIHGVALNDVDLPLIDLESVDGTEFTRDLGFCYVIYAVGFASESSEYAEGKLPGGPYENVQFWAPDCLADAKLGFGKKPRVGILGSGDGAMQDTLRCLVRADIPHALAAWDCLMATATKTGPLRDSPHVATAMAKVAAADAYTTAGAIWTPEVKAYEALDKVFADIIADLMKVELAALIKGVNHLVRSDVLKVTLVNRPGYFTKAYALNRFMVLLLHEMLKLPGCKHQVKLEIMAGEVRSFTSTISNKRGGTLMIKTSSGIKRRVYNLVIIRGGLDRFQHPTQLTGLSGLDPGRAELGRIPPPIRPF